MRLRVIAGTLGSRTFDSPDGFTTHPMGERIRGALFNILGDIEGFHVLDAFSGSGALSFEAVSRGAAKATAVERDRIAQRIIAKNIEQLGVEDRVELIRANVSQWSLTSADKRYDLILCDPPYNNLQLSTVSKLITHLKPNSLMVLSLPGRESAPTVNGVVVVDKRLYGDAALAFYQKVAAE
ncbi:16S rRNA (guanine(966)-N(2))-methyltransferase RsmD [Candidatus Saccharibacteria bacterium]|nr:MAG: 16S rRNA (guanine(966)-N(2))-methyltransferase RsmD [Candidatus Saccharibacteria bacterium]